ncbi:uncharacterized protein LOC125489023 isoform X5 [Plutella xylostella]|uniref:uncharacterized protein LOC125489023 isoform X5 n=1 Tax=Plutella xylostella TaxID=51655 RepID=UPI00203258B6|nr:uncharacterized protein LOC125489023 isoform X5 [Plutella xylostella]
MLKGCFECLECLGNSAVRDRFEADGAYGSHIKGNSQVSTALPPWPAPSRDNETMFLLPRALRDGDSINVSVKTRGISERRQMSLNLVTGSSYIDYDNTAFKLDLDFTDNITVSTIHNGNNETISTKYITFGINIGSDNVVDIYIGSTFFEQLTLKHSLDQIRYLTLEGDIIKVNQLDFVFA